MTTGIVLGENSIEHNAKIVTTLTEKNIVHVSTVNVCMLMVNIYLSYTPCTKQGDTKGLRKRPLVPWKTTRRVRKVRYTLSPTKLGMVGSR